MNVVLSKPVDLFALAAAVSPETRPVGSVTSLEVETKLATYFRGEAATQAGNVARALRQRNWEELKRHAHYLKGSASVVRDNRLFAACNSVEAAADARDTLAAERAWVTCAAALQRWAAPVVRLPRRNPRKQRQAA
jgi:HPt (histidine-containing phosphotransfer) domain-containing protein